MYFSCIWRRNLSEYIFKSDSFVVNNHNIKPKFTGRGLSCLYKTMTFINYLKTACHCTLKEMNVTKIITIVLKDPFNVVLSMA